METSRRNFLKLGGAWALGLAILPAVKGFAANNPEHLVNPKAMAGKRWGLVIDMQKCWPRYQAGCRRCFDTCRREHNIPDIGNKKEEIKWIWTEPYGDAFPDQQHELMAEDIKNNPFIVLCNHCDKPPCVRVCPTRATFKRQDGIVMIDYHRCIGCRYCMAACPYGARSFNFRDPRPYIKELNPAYPTREKGVVEKCTLCVERIDTGLPPACVEVCPAKAITFGDLEDPSSEARQLLKNRYTIQRKPELGTHPSIYYIV
ncbi:4Fe-4S ferredoxin [Moorella thermoacetica]|uniref:Putative sulfite reductase-associated electron transfer protein DsrO n=1 Tax=Moorella thermoacetica (strain ATCC 39073 / JCM 9320) TaxID=264732 RepID=Q2RI29_MOOTA|nr:4Fe-4S dicluster domain-containing protein [Moorella thermoacetica]AKX94396.1 tetrathionate reductase subunit B precursor [Moorella thermoacetica]AKX97032.1 tetrathionate reductase subunit B precursor [Moorella thermoacetica]OIQ58203.1 tetrathionate reductase subunit B precursor [Moorella thermoacetica]QDA00862.1 Tetrathionate reductase subunit B precursor [Moorella thermoacetica]TYL11757.1 Tetrathionate reductase subunit B [Moorella thermoacetica]